MSNSDNNEEVGILNTIISALNSQDIEVKQRILETVSRFFDISLSSAPRPAEGRTVASGWTDEAMLFSEEVQPSPKEFLLEKQPETDIERVTCLAYYLTHYRDMPHFKTLDLSKLNTEAAQPKLSNATFASGNAAKRNLLVQAGRGHRQLSAIGEQFVRVLPDRDQAKAVLASSKPRRKSKKMPKKKSSTQGNKR